MVHCVEARDNLWESVLFFHGEGPRAQTQVVSHNSGHHYLISHLAGLDVLVYIKVICAGCGSTHLRSSTSAEAGRSAG